MLTQALRRAAQLVALAVSLTAFAVVLVSVLPSMLPDESESEREHEVACDAEYDVRSSAPSLVVDVPHRVTEIAHVIRATEVLRTRNVTFRIDRPPPT
jgi:hypothetical protein